MIANVSGIGRDSSRTSRCETKKAGPLPDSVAENIQKMASEDAQNGVYMGEKFVHFCKQYKQTNLTPDYSNLKLRLMSLLNRQSYTGRNLLFNLFGYSCKMGVGLTQNFISVCDKSGDEVLFYDSNQGWIARPSKAENRFQSEATDVYYRAYKAARMEMKTNSVQIKETAAGSGLDQRA